MKKSASPLRALLLGALSCLSIAAAAPLVTSQNSTLSIPAARISMAGLPWATNLAGSNFMLSSVAAATEQGGKATLVNSLQWLRRYNGGPGSFANGAYSMARRSDGGVVVCGPSYSPGTGYDFATVCYATDGTALWTNRYDGPAHSTDTARFVATSASGDVWAAGESERQLWLIPSDIVLIKYSSNGAPVWTNRIASFGTNSSYPQGLTVDSTGNAYVSESATVWLGMGVGTPVGDAITKFDPAGNVLWIKSYPRTGPDSGQGIFYPGYLRLDDEDNVILAGESGRPHYVTGKSIVKFNREGTPIWTNHHTDALSLVPRTLTIDRAGNLVLTEDGWDGWSGDGAYGIMKCSSAGATLWTNQVPGPSYLGGYVPQAVPDAQGNVFFVGGSPGASSGLYDLLKFGSNGAPLWTNRSVHFGSTNGSFVSAAVDNAGNFYVLGYSKAPERTDYDIVLLKYSGDGSPLWTNRFDGPAGLDDGALSLAVDDRGSVYVSGSSRFAPGSSDFVTLQYADSLVYRPPPNFTGSDTLTCTLTDRLGNRATGSVEVVVLPGSFRFDLSPTRTRLTPAGLHLELSGLPGTNDVVLEASLDLYSWQRIQTNAPSGNSVEFLDPSALTFPRRFYRASQEP